MAFKIDDMWEELEDPENENQLYRDIKKPTPRKKNLLTPKQMKFLQAYTTTHKFNIYDACMEAEVLRNTYGFWYANYPLFRKIVDDFNDSIVDQAINELWKHVKAGDLRAITYVLDRLGKHRGFDPKENQTTINQPLQINITRAQDGNQPPSDESV